jgi:glycogen synthase
MGTNSLKVLMFGWELPPHYGGGLGIACNGLARQLADCGIDITFVLPKKIAVDAEYMNVIFANVKEVVDKRITESSVNLLRSSYIGPERYRELREELRGFCREGFFRGTLIEEVLGYGRLAGDIASEKDFDIIHIHEWLCVPCGINAKKKSGKPLVFHVHATEYDRSGGRGVNPQVYEIEKAGLEAADKVIAISSRMKDMLVKNYGICQEKIDVVHNGVDKTHLSGFGKTSNKLQALKHGGNKVVLYAGRLTIQKGVDYFLKAAQKVLKIEKKVIFLIVGSGDMERQLIRQAAEMGISDKVFFAGWLKGKELFESYTISDLFVMPSVSEPFGLNPLELMMLGKPVIISKQSGVSEAVFHALKVDFWDVEEMANKIMAVARYDSLSSQLSNFGQQEVKHVNWKKAAKKCILVYKSLLPEVVFVGS